MSKELIEKLREYADGEETPMYVMGLMNAAADALEAKAAPVGEREAFEAAYAAECGAARGVDCTASDIVGMRDGDGYGDRPYLNGQWKGWQARAAHQRAQQPSWPSAGVVMPERKVNHNGDSQKWISWRDGWNACLDEFARLNGKEVGRG